jgi:hypothetical protein
MSRYQEVRFWILFVVLLGFLMLWPVTLELSSRHFGRLGLAIVRNILLLSWVLAVSNKARIAIVVLVLGIGLAVSRWLFEFGFGMVFDNVSHVLAFVIVLIVAVAILIDVMRAGEVTLHLIVGAVSVYLMLILLWTFLYDAIETLRISARTCIQMGLPRAMLAYPTVTMQTSYRSSLLRSSVKEGSK